MTDMEQPPGNAKAVASHPRGRRRRGLARRVREAWDLLISAPLLWLTIFLLTGTWSLLPSGFLGFRSPEAGDVARRDFVAPRPIRVIDVDATEVSRGRVSLSVPPIYSLDPAVAAATTGELQQIFAAGRRVLEESRAEVDQGAEEPTAATLVGRIRQSLADAGVDPPAAPVLRTLLVHQFSTRLEERLASLTDEIYQRGLVADKAELLVHRDTGILLQDRGSGEESLQLDLYEALDIHREATSLVEMRLRTLFDLGPDVRESLSELVTGRLAPNLIPEREETMRRRDEAASAVTPTHVAIRRGQVIVRAGDRISATQAAAIAAIEARPGLRALLLPATGYLMFAGLLALVLWLGLPRRQVRAGQRPQRFAEVLLLLAISLLGARFCLFAARALSESFQFSPFNDLQPYLHAIPFAALAIICQLLFGRQLTLLVSILFAVAIGQMFGDDGAWILLYVFAGSLAALFAQEAITFKQRSALVRTGLAVGGANVLMLLLQAAVQGGLAGGGGASGLAFSLFCALIGGLLAAGIASFLVPVFEILLSATTEIKLVELANTNLPLLQRLALEAPGTFQHSLMVANLAKAGCAAIGADPVLAYTGGLYHDIGKVTRPEYFVENQRPGQNPHDNLSPAMSALVIVSHVKDGLELAREHHLPQPLLDAIGQHHGTRRLAFFLDRALQRADPRVGPVSDEKYCYPGPRPQDKVMAVLMLADGVEAASRTLADPAPSKLRSVIRAILDACMEERQFDETDITLKDLRRVSEAFLQLLAHVYHRRLDYPGFDFQSSAGRPGVHAARRATGVR